MDLNNEYLLKEAQKFARFGMFIYDIKRDIWTNSDTLDELFGINKSIVKNFDGWLSTVHSSQRDEMKTYAEAIIQNGGNFIKEYRAICENDKMQIWVELKGKVYFDEFGKPDKLAGTIHDISELKNSEEKYKKLYAEKRKREELQKSIEKERRKIDELKECDKIKTEFFANISHELRTPVNVIFSALQMEELMLRNLLVETQGNDNYKYINMMKQNCYRLIRLINNFIDLTKINTDYLQINETNHDIISLVENVTLSVAEYIENKGISITFDTDVEEKIIACDAEKIERIILNLLSNAVKFTPRGGSIFINMEDHGSSLCIKVKDTGRGIPEYKLNSIFERFVQVDKPLRKAYEGSGIGLSIVKALVELHGGEITVESKVGKGTEFTINMPCNLIKNEAGVNSESDSQILDFCNENVKIEFSNIYK